MKMLPSFILFGGASLLASCAGTNGSVASPDAQAAQAVSGVVNPTPAAPQLTAPATASQTANSAINGINKVGNTVRSAQTIGGLLR